MDERDPKNIFDFRRERWALNEWGVEVLVLWADEELPPGWRWRDREPEPARPPQAAYTRRRTAPAG